MSILDPTGEKPGSKGRDFTDRDPNVFGVPGSLNPAAGHHLSPVAKPDDAPAPRLDWGMIAEQFPFGLIILGPGQEILHENGVCRTMLGTTIREAGGLGAWFASLCPDEDHRKRVAESFHEHVWRNQLTRTFSLRSLHGKLREIEFRSSLHRDGGITIVLQDVTETLRAQEAQQHGKLKFRALFAAMDNGAVLVDRTGRIIDANPAFLDFVELSLREIRMESFRDLLDPEDADRLEAAEADFLASRGTTAPPPLEVRTRSGNGEKSTQLSFQPIGEIHGDPSMTLYLTGSASGDRAAFLLDRLSLVARKAKALLDSVPDLIFLIDEDLTVADFAPPPHPWRELKMRDSWRGQSIEAIWPALGELLSDPRRELIDAGKIVHADLFSQQEEPVQFTVTLSSAGDGQIIAVVRNQSELRRTREAKQHLLRAFDHLGGAAVIADGNGRILEANAAIRALVGDPDRELIGKPLTALLDETSCMLVAQHLPTGKETGMLSAFQAKLKRRHLPPLETTLRICSLSDPGEPVTFALFADSEEVSAGHSAGLNRERAGHHFRNQLQMVTSLFSMESHDVEKDETLLKWQLRLRSLACAIPGHEPGGDAPRRLGKLIRQVSDEAARLMQLGPGERFILVNGPDATDLEDRQLTPMALLIGELIRITVSHRKPGSTPRLQFTFADSGERNLALEFLAGNLQATRFPEEESGTIKLLVAQMGGHISGTVKNSHRGWTFQFPR